MTIREIAEAANVSRATVSYVINGKSKVSPETRERVLKIIEESGYKPNYIAKSLRKSRTNTIGVIVEDITSFQTPYLVSTIHNNLEAIGYEMILIDLGLVSKTGFQYERMFGWDNEVKNAFEILESRQVDGLIYIAMVDRDVTALLPPTDKPIVCAYCYSSAENAVSISYDNYNISEEIVDYLVEMNHKKIALFTGDPFSEATILRHKGYEKAMLRHKLSVPKEYVCYGDWEFETGKRMFKEIIALPDPPTAIISMNEEMALGAIYAGEELGYRVGEKMSIVGYNNREFSAYIHPSLTTAGFPLAEIGKTSAEYMVALIEEKPISEKKLFLPCTLIKRDSVIKLTESDN